MVDLQVSIKMNITLTRKEIHTAIDSATKDFLAAWQKQLEAEAMRERLLCRLYDQADCIYED